MQSCGHKIIIQFDEQCLFQASSLSIGDIISFVFSCKLHTKHACYECLAFKIRLFINAAYDRSRPMLKRLPLSLCGSSRFRVPYNVPGIYNSTFLSSMRFCYRIVFFLISYEICFFCSNIYLKARQNRIEN